MSVNEGVAVPGLIDAGCDEVQATTSRIMIQNPRYITISNRTIVNCILSARNIEITASSSVGHASLLRDLMALMTSANGKMAIVSIPGYLSCIIFEYHESERKMFCCSKVRAPGQVLSLALALSALV